MGVEGGVNLLRHLPRGRSFNPNVDEGQDAVDANKSDGLIFNLDARDTAVRIVETSNTNIEYTRGPYWGEWTGNPNVGTQAETVAEIGEDPWGRKSLLFISRNNQGNDFDGGWNGTNFNIDRTKEYRITFWVNVRKKGSSGTIYLGMYMNGGGFIHRTGGSAQGNPYFSYISHSNALFNEGEWLMICYCIKPAGTSTSWAQPNYTGAYRPDGTRIQIGSGGLGEGNTGGGGMFSSTGTTMSNRTYLYYSTDSSVEVDWYWPRMDVVEGNEPSPTDMLNYPHDSFNCNAGSGVSLIGLPSTSPPTLTRGKYWSFNGSNQRLVGNNVLNMNVGSTGLSIVVWFNTSTFNQSGFLFEKGAVNSSYCLFIHDNVLYFRTKQNTVQKDLTQNNIGTTLAVNQWHMVVGTFDGTTKKLYADGALLGTQTYAVAIDTNNNGVSIGAYGGQSTNDYEYNGKIASVKVYKCAINQEQVSHEYNSMQKYFRTLG